MNVKNLTDSLWVALLDFPFSKNPEVLQKILLLSVQLWLHLAAWIKGDIWIQISSSNLSSSSLCSFSQFFFPYSWL